MRLSKGFWQTYKEVPSDAVVASHQLMMRAGMLHKLTGGVYAYLPFAIKAIQKIENIIREELDKADCHELLMSVITPGNLWEESGRWNTMGPEMLRFKDRKGFGMCFSPTNEEAITDIFKKSINSYKQLPLTLYQINTKFRDEVRPRYGLLRGREFTMKDAYSFHMDKECLDETYDRLYKAYQNIIEKIGLEYIVVEADGGAMADGDSKTHEFQVIAEDGEDEILYSSEAGYAANIEKAKTVRKNLNFADKSGELVKVETPDMKTIADVCNFLEVPQTHSLKSLVYTSVTEIKTGKKKGETLEKHHLIMLLGDDDLNETKLKNHLAAEHLKPSTDETLSELGFTKGFIGPVDVDTETKNINILYDEAIDTLKAFVVGCSDNLHYKNFVPGDITKVDLRLSREGDFTESGHAVVKKKGIEVGHIFQLGSKYTLSMKATVLNRDGKQATPLMGCYGLGVTRILAAAIEQSHDEKGIIWPKSIAPYDLHYVMISKKGECKPQAEKIYTELKEKFSIVFDDRSGLGPGFMFKDAELLGLPITVVFGERDYKENGTVEIRVRKTGEKIKVKPDELVSKVSEIFNEL